MLDGQPIGTIYLESDSREMDSRLRRCLGIVILVTLGSSILALLVSTRVQRAISRPILHLVAAARSFFVGNNVAVPRGKAKPR